MAKEWFSVAEIAKLSGVPESTVRRYLSRFARFFRFEDRSRGRRYFGDAPLIISRIHAMYARGYETDDIERALMQEFPVSIEDSHPITTPPPEHQALASKQDILEAFAKLQEELAATREELQALREYVSGRMEERDRQLMEALREIQATKVEKKPWWRRLFT